MRRSQHFSHSIRNWFGLVHRFHRWYSIVGNQASSVGKLIGGNQNSDFPAIVRISDSSWFIPVPLGIVATNRSASTRWIPQVEHRARSGLIPASGMRQSRAGVRTEIPQDTP